MGAIKHQVQRTAGVVTTLAIVACVAFGGWSLYVAFIKPHVNPTKTTTQKAAQINNPHYNPRPGFGGCAHMTIHENYGKKEKK